MAEPTQDNLSKERAVQQELNQVLGLNPVLSSKFMQLIEKGDQSQVEILLQQTPHLIWTRDENGTSPLHFAARHGFLGLVELLIRAGHPWNAQNYFQKTAGEEAHENNHQEVYDWLVGEGCRTELILSVLEQKDELEAMEETEVDVDLEQEEKNEEVAEDEKETRQHSTKESVQVQTDEKQDSADSTEPSSASNSSRTPFSFRSTRPPSNQAYLSQPAVYNTSTTSVTQTPSETASPAILFDQDSNAVMHSWESPIMKEHVEKLVGGRKGLRILNVGFGLGLIDTLFQQTEPSLHTIIEAHPDVYQKMINDGWDKKPNVQILHGRWQEVTNSLIESGEQFDVIFFDTFGEYYSDMKEFHEQVVLSLLSVEEGRYSFFNGLGATNSFFHDVACRLVELDLLSLSIQTTFHSLALDTSTIFSSSQWEGVRAQYWTLSTYRLPICTFAQ